MQGLHEQPPWRCDDDFCRWWVGWLRSTVLRWIAHVGKIDGSAGDCASACLACAKVLWVATGSRAVEIVLSQVLHFTLQTSDAPAAVLPAVVLGDHNYSSPDCSCCHTGRASGSCMHVV